SAAESAKEIVDLVQLRRHHIMVIVAPGVARDSSGCSLYSRGPACHAEALRRRVCHISLKVIQRYDDDRSRAWQNLLWITAFFFAALHVTHFSGRTLSQPILKLSGMGREAQAPTRQESNPSSCANRTSSFFNSSPDISTDW